MFNVFLISGVSKWVNKDEARRLQGRGEVVYVLEMNNEDPDSAENLFYCGIKNKFCDIHSMSAAP